MALDSILAAFFSACTNPPANKTPTKTNADIRIQLSLVI
jgi:Tfp pilus assembly protein PilF